MRPSSSVRSYNQINFGEGSRNNHETMPHNEIIAALPDKGGLAMFHTDQLFLHSEENDMKLCTEGCVANLLYF